MKGRGVMLGLLMLTLFTLIVGVTVAVLIDKGVIGSNSGNKGNPKTPFI